MFFPRLDCSPDAGKVSSLCLVAFLPTPVLRPAATFALGPPVVVVEVAVVESARGLRTEQLGRAAPSRPSRNNSGGTRGQMREFRGNGSSLGRNWQGHCVREGGRGSGVADEPSTDGQHRPPRLDILTRAGLL